MISMTTSTEVTATVALAIALILGIVAGAVVISDLLSVAHQILSTYGK